MNIGIVSLSSGIVGEAFMRFEVDIGLRRLKEYGLNVSSLSPGVAGAAAMMMTTSKKYSSRFMREPCFIDELFWTTYASAWYNAYVQGCNNITKWHYDPVTAVYRQPGNERETGLCDR